MDMGLPQRNKKTVQATAIAGLISLGLAATAQADGDTQSPQWVGKHVTLRIGKGFNAFAADSIARGLMQEGCPVTVTNEGGDKYLPRLTVEVGDYSGKFKSGEIGDAGHVAETLCLGRDRTQK